MVPSGWVGQTAARRRPAPMLLIGPNCLHPAAWAPDLRHPPATYAPGWAQWHCTRPATPGCGSPPGSCPPHRPCSNAQAATADIKGSQKARSPLQHACAVQHAPSSQAATRSMHPRAECCRSLAPQTSSLPGSPVDPAAPLPPAAQRSARKDGEHGDHAPQRAALHTAAAVSRAVVSMRAGAEARQQHSAQQRQQACCVISVQHSPSPTLACLLGQHDATTQAGPHSTAQHSTAQHGTAQPKPDPSLPPWPARCRCAGSPPASAPPAQTAEWSGRGQHPVLSHPIPDGWTAHAAQHTARSHLGSREQRPPNQASAPTEAPSLALRFCCSPHLCGRLPLAADLCQVVTPGRAALAERRALQVLAARARAGRRGGCERPGEAGSRRGPGLGRGTSASHAHAPAMAQQQPLLHSMADAVGTCHAVFSCSSIAHMRCTFMPHPHQQSTARTSLLP